MATSNVYITIGLDKKGNVQEVRVDGKVIEPKETPKGRLNEGGEAPGCEKILKRLEHELLVCRKRDRTPPTPGTPPVEDPCCYRDPQTGRLWCWC